MEEFDLATDMASALWFITKLADKRYAQNLYAALCNNDFQKQDAWQVLKNSTWACSWRSAGGIVADLRGSGEDYLDYYCSGIGDGLGNGDADRTIGYVSEGTVTDEIEQDLLKLGWVAVTDTNSQ